jgi:tetratricopeptide (TPR) repeat protein
MLTGDISIVFKQIAFYIIIGFASNWVANNMGFMVSALFQIAVILFTPAMIIMLVATESLIAAINPVLFISMTWRIGWSYLLMFLFLLMLKFAPLFLWQYLLSYLPGTIQLFLLPIAIIYYLFVAYHLMGYVLLQYHEEIGYDVDVEEEELIADGTIEKHVGKSEILNRVDMLIQDGKVDEAIALIKEETAGNISDIHLAERYYKLLNIKQIIPEMLSHAKLYLDLLVKQKAGQQVCKVYQDCLVKDSEFLPSSETLLKVAGYLNDSAKPEEAVQTYNRFIKADPKNKLVPKAYFLAASVINEKLKNKPKAVSILNAVVKKYPNHEIIPYVQRYLKQIA